MRVHELRVVEDDEGAYRWELSEDGETVNSGVWRMPDDVEDEDYKAWFVLYHSLKLAQSP